MLEEKALGKKGKYVVASEDVRFSAGFLYSMEVFESIRTLSLASSRLFLRLRARRSVAYLDRHSEL